MPSIIGNNTLRALSERILLPNIIDGVYSTNALYFRLSGSNKKNSAGGMHWEQPFLTGKKAAGGAYEGYDVLDVTPEDVVENGGWDMKQYFTSVTISGKDLARFNSADAAVNILTHKAEHARMDLADKLGTGLYTDIVTSVKEIDGLKGAIDDGTVSTSYAGLTRATRPFLNAQRDASTATLTLAAVDNMVTNCTQGGWSTSLILSRKEQFRRAKQLCLANQRFVTGATEANLAAAGFMNFTYDNIPWVIDSKVFDGPNTSNSAILFLNENVMNIYTMSDVDFEQSDWVRPANQDAMTSLILWYGNLIVDLPYVNGVMTNVSA